MAEDWEGFEKLVGCMSGDHTDDAEAAKVEFYKSSTVETASTALRKAEIAAMKTAKDFERE